MDQKPSDNSIRENVLAAIKTGEVKARSKQYFFFQTALLAAGVVLSALLLLFLASFIVFALRQNDVWFLPSFGLRGILAWLRALPWLLILAALLALGLLELLLKRYQFSYRRPLLYSFVGIGLVMAIGSMAVSGAHIHEELLEAAKQHRLIFGEPLYRAYGMPHMGNLTRGLITEKNDDGCDIQTALSENLRVLITDQTQLPFGYNFDVGDMVIVFGPRRDNVIQALGIRKIDAGRAGGFTRPQMMPGF